MSSKKKGVNTTATERARHLRPEGKRDFWQGERRVTKEVVRKEGAEPCCDTLPEEFEGLSVKDIEELAGLLERVETDTTKWESIFKCKLCGQKWKEKYFSTGHGDVPTTRKC